MHRKNLYNINNKTVIGLLFISLFCITIGYSLITRDLSIMGKAYIPSDNVRKIIANGLKSGELLTDASSTNDFGSKYYFTGSNPNNYVIFNNACWRIVNIANNNTVKLVYEAKTTSMNDCVGVATETSGALFDNFVFSNNNNNFYASTIKTNLDNYSNGNINNNINLSESNIERIETATFYVGAVNKDDTLSNMVTQEKINKGASSLSDKTEYTYTNKIGLLNASDLKKSADYLIKNYSYYTINVSDNSTNTAICQTNNGINSCAINSANRIRPVLYLKSNTYYTGEGTELEPYRVLTNGSGSEIADNTGIIFDESCFEFDVDTNTITSYDSTCPKDVIIPNTIKGVEVKVIGEDSFRNKQINSVVLSNNITTLSDYAFAYNNLTDVSIGANVSTVGYRAFYTNKLESIELSEGVKTIGASAFNENNLTEVTIPSTVTSIDAAAFYTLGASNQNLTKITNKSSTPFDWKYILKYFRDDNNINSTYGLMKLPSGEYTKIIVLSGEGLYEDSTEPGRYIYRGENPNNHISFNDEEWRILSIEQDGSFKLIKQTSIAKTRWDVVGTRTSTTSTYCVEGEQNGCGAWAATSNLVNRPSEFYLYYPDGSPSSTKYAGTVTADSSLNTYLNNTYLNSDETINETSKGLKNVKKYLTANKFYVGSPGDYSDTDSISVNMQQEKQFTWIGNVGLITASEYMKGSTNSECVNMHISNENPEACGTNNWINNETYFWTISPFSQSTRRSAWTVQTNGKLWANMTGYYDQEVRPVVYLKSSVSITGDGSSTSNFTISN